VFENKVLRRVFGLKIDEVMGGWRKLHNEEPHDLYSSPSISRTMKSRRMRWAGHLSEIGWIGMDWIDLAQDRDQWKALVNTVMNLRVP
jgi:hypothetical protein